MDAAGKWKKRAMEQGMHLKVKEMACDRKSAKAEKGVECCGVKLHLEWINECRVSAQCWSDALCDVHLS